MTDTTKRPSVFDMFSTDRDAEENGKWITLAPGVEMKIRRFKSKHTTRVREALEKPFERVRRNGNLPQDIMEKIVHEVLCTSTVVDWRGDAIVGQDGNPMPFSAQAVDELLTALPELRDEVTGHALRMDNFRAADDKDTEGN